MRYHPEGSPKREEEAVDVNLVAVQAKTELNDYRSNEAFHAKMASLMERAMREVDRDLPTLISYPELVGLFLSFVPYYWDDLKDETNVEAAILKIVMKNMALLSEEDRKTPETAARIRYLVAEAEPVILGYDPDNWAAAFDYHSHPIDTALATVDAVRANTVPLLRRLPDDAWDKEATHSESGRYTGIGWLLIYAAHLEQHADQISRTLEVWRASAVP